MITLFRVGEHRDYKGVIIDFLNIELPDEDRSLLGFNFGNGGLVLDVLFLRFIIYDRS